MQDLNTSDLNNPPEDMTALSAILDASAKTYNPARRADESFADYKVRRSYGIQRAKANRTETARIGSSTHRTPASGEPFSKTSSKWNHRQKVAFNTEQAGLATSPKFLKERKRKVKASTPASWPKSRDQLAQSRPLIVIRPVRAFRLGLNEAGRTLTMKDQKVLSKFPKHLIDMAVLTVKTVAAAIADGPTIERAGGLFTGLVQQGEKA